jgi:adenosylcobalamin-dependent ribonucleoside-triphosphate reductase
MVSTRANIITRRTYNRPINDEGTEFETWEQTIDRVIEHQAWLWERAKGSALTNLEHHELGTLKRYMMQRLATVSGRTLWLGGTEVSKTREASQFNCSFGRIETVHDVVDAFWLLLQGCGVGFEPVRGVLNGFTEPVLFEDIRSTRKDKGNPNNQESFYSDDSGQVWHLKVGDSAEAWAKAVGKILAMKQPVDKIIVDYSEIRPGGVRLKGYGWISSGDETLSIAIRHIVNLMNKRAGSLLSRMDILDVLTHLGTTLSSRRSAEIALMPVEDVEVDDFIVAKKDFWLHGNEHRQQSNNSIMFYNKPTKWELHHIFQKMQEAGGSEPGFINAQAAERRAPWFKGVNPCAEILLGNKSFCNLVEVDWGKMINMPVYEKYEIIFLVARANYRQTCVNLDDGILQRSWHELNEFLRLCGVGGTGLVKYLDANTIEANKDSLILFKEAAWSGAVSMADELGLPRPKAVTTVKPSGTLSKIMDTTEGVHRPLGKYIFNNVTFSKHDPLVQLLRDANYKVMDKPFEPDSVIATFPVAYEDVKFDVVQNSKGEDVYVNNEYACTQLDRYKLLMDYYVDHNCSVTISYSQEEVPAIVDWILQNWDSYVGVSFIYRNDPSKTAADLGYAYLPQEVVTKETYDTYVATLLPISLEEANSFDEFQGEGCATGACPIR